MIEISLIIFGYSIILARRKRGDVCTFILALFGLGAEIVYFYILFSGATPLSLGALGRYVNLSPDPFGVEIVTSVCLLAITMASHLAAPTSRSGPISLSFRFGTITKVGVLLFSLMCVISIFEVVSISTLISYHGYGSIKDFNDLYSSQPLAKVFASSLRIAIMMLIVVAVFESKNKNYIYAAVATLIIATGVLIALAQASRMAAVYFAILSAALYATNRRRAAIISICASLVVSIGALEARQHTDLGLYYFLGYSESAFDLESILNVLQNELCVLLVTSASVKVSVPDQYNEIYKLLSVIPSFNFIDGFQGVRSAYEQRINVYIPFNAFGEVWAFGSFYFLYFWAVVTGAVILCQRSIHKSKILFFSVFAVLFLGIVYSSQYPVRNSLRYFYFVYLIYIADMCLRHLKRRGAESAGRVPHSAAGKNPAMTLQVMRRRWM